MRPIKFRYRIKLATDEIHTEIVNLADLENGYLKEYIVPSCKILTKDQFTGLHDKNNKEIYERDIVESWDKVSNNYGRSMVEWHNQGYWYFQDGDEIEVIGNKWENPELI